MMPNITLPKRIADLPRDERGYPVPFFVQWFDEKGQPTKYGVGKPDLRIADARKSIECLKQRVCWVCGQPLGSWTAFVGGPRSCENRVFADGPMHVDCAEFSAQYCPHLATPNARRREDERMEKTETLPGHISEHPVKVGVFVSRGFGIMRCKGGFYWVPKQAERIEWFEKGKRLEVKP